LFVFSERVYASGEVVAWGDNNDGQCNVPAPNTSFTTAAAGWFHSLGLKADGTIAAWGHNEYGECNVPEPNTGFKVIAANGFHSLGLKQDGSIAAWGSNSEGECNVPEPNTGFKAIAAGSEHSLGLKTNGSVTAWGNNADNQCNVPEPNTGFITIAAGAYHSLGLKANGSIAAWGHNRYGECNVPAPNTGFIAIAAGGYCSSGLKQDGSVVTWGDIEEGGFVMPEPNTGFTAIATSGLISVGLKQNGSIAVWGYTFYGDFTVPEPNARFSVIATNGDFILGVRRFNINITKCTITAGKTQGQDAIKVSGTVELPAELDFNDVNHIDVNIVSLTDNKSVYTQTVDANVVKGKFQYKAKSAITSLTVDSKKGTFSITGKNINLTGLTTPMKLNLTMSGVNTGDHKVSGDADELAINGTKKLIPTRLMRTYDDKLVVNKAKAKHNSKKAFSDTLTVGGDMAVIVTDVNLCNYDVNFVWGTNKFSVGPGSFKAAKTGHLYKCSKVAADANGNAGTVTAQLDIDKATFTLSVTGADGLDATSSSIPFEIRFADFNEMVNVYRTTGRSW
jgi:alpha-tubulin suppressor-like RCC1 family protein